MVCKDSVRAVIGATILYIYWKNKKKEISQKGLSKPIKINVDAPSGEEFELNSKDGSLKIKNISSLVKELKKIDEEQLKEYVNDKKNDIAYWISNSLKLKDLSTGIAKLKTKKEIIKTLENALKKDGKH